MILLQCLNFQRNLTVQIFYLGPITSKIYYPTFVFLPLFNLYTYLYPLLLNIFRFQLKNFSDSQILTPLASSTFPNPNSFYHIPLLTFLSQVSISSLFNLFHFQLNSLSHMPNSFTFQPLYPNFQPLSLTNLYI